MTNGSITPRPDGEWFVDFDRFGPKVHVRFSFIGAIAAAVVAGGLALWASPLEGQAAGTLLATALLPLAGTANALKGAEVDVVLANPGGKLYVVLASFAGADGSSNPVPLNYQQFILARLSTP